MLHRFARIAQDTVYGLAALVDEGTEACAKNSNYARIAVRPLASAIAPAATSSVARIAVGRRWGARTSTRTMNGGGRGWGDHLFRDGGDRTELAEASRLLLA